MMVVFRVDASIKIGTGHVMRCLTLADALSGQGIVCQFISREHYGNLIGYIRNKGYTVDVLPASLGNFNSNGGLAHAAWLGSSQQEDMGYCQRLLSREYPDWLIVDHYGLDHGWEKPLRSYCNKLMVIDDLADRIHDCDLLLDQTLGRDAEEYFHLVPDTCQVLPGSQYALLRPEFAAGRWYSLQRRRTQAFKRVLITLGGIDKDNMTGQILAALKQSSLPHDCEITVVMGPTAPWLSEIETLAQSMPWRTSVKAGVADMAQLMADSDLAIGAAGATSWERCCLGLPTIMVVLADNQQLIAQRLKKAGAAEILESGPGLAERLVEHLVTLIGNQDQLLNVSEAAAKIIDGKGVARMVGQMQFRKKYNDQ